MIVVEPKELVYDLKPGDTLHLDASTCLLVSGFTGDANTVHVIRPLSPGTHEVSNQGGSSLESDVREQSHKK
jgi:hypothetical protein